MTFNKIDVKSIIEKERKNKEFDSEYEKVKQEYNLIEKFIERASSGEKNPPPRKGTGYHPTFVETC